MKANFIQWLLHSVFLLLSFLRDKIYIFLKNFEIQLTYNVVLVLHYSYYFTYSSQQSHGVDTIIIAILEMRTPRQGMGE